MKDGAKAAPFNMPFEPTPSRVNAAFFPDLLAQPFYGWVAARSNQLARFSGLLILASAEAYLKHAEARYRQINELTQR